MAAHHRIDALERAFGPLTDPDNPLGQAAWVASDAAGEVLTAGERALDALGFQAEFVPAAEGGRLTRMDVLGRVLRPVFRRDASLGFGYGLGCFFAAAPVWTAGTAAQRRTVAEKLLGGGRVAVARHEVAHGNDFVRDEFTARPRPEGGFVLRGSKTAVANASRATALVVFARTGDADTSAGRHHSVLLVDRTALPAGRLVALDRQLTSGLRSTEFGGLEAHDCPVPGDALVGAVGDGYALSLRSSLLIRGLIPSIVLAGADTALRLTAGFAAGRRAGGRSPLGSQHVRDALVGAFLDLLVSDCMALVATRAAHLMPRHVSVYAAAAAYLAPKLVTESMDVLSTVLGKARFATGDDAAMFRKQLRDLPVTSLGHAGSAGRQVSILPQLPVFARDSWFRSPQPPDALFRPHEPLPPVDPGGLALLADSDPLAATLVFCTAGSQTAVPDATRPLVDRLTSELAELRREFRDVAPDDRVALTSPHRLGLADRYAVVLAGAAAVGVWQQARADGAAATGPFLGDPAWLDAALRRLVGRLGTLPGGPPPDEGRVLAELLARLHGGRSYDLYGSRLAA